MNVERNKFSPHSPKSRISPVQAVLLAVAVVIAIPLIFLIVFAYGISHTVADQDVAGATRISSDWVELVPKQPLKSTRWTQALILELSPGMPAATASIVASSQPEVELIDEYRNTYRLHVAGKDSRTMVFSSELVPLPRDRVYSKVRLRSDSPITCSRIVWRNEDHK